MKKIIEYFISRGQNLHPKKLDSQVVREIRKLHRQDRIQLRNELFKQAKAFESDENVFDVVNWLQKCFQVIDLHSFRFNQVFFSPGNEIKEEIKKLLNGATQSVDLCIFTITDHELASRIIAAHKRGCKVRLITDDEKTEDNGSEFRLLKKMGIPIRIDHSSYHMHNKFGIIDKKIAITGSFNWTYTATKHNQENLMATSKYEIVKQYSDEFDHLWKKLFDF